MTKARFIGDGTLQDPTGIDHSTGRSRRLTCGAALALALGMNLWAGVAHAGGFYLDERSVRASGRAYAGAAAIADDAGAQTYNPATLAALSGSQISGGGYLIMPRARVRNDGSHMDVGPFTGIPVGGADDQGFDPQPTGYLHLATPVTPDFWLGLSASVPFGLKDEYDADFFGRYDSTRSKVVVIELAPSIAWAATPQLSLGATLSVQRASVTLVNAVPNPFDPESDGSFHVKGKDWSVGYALGVLWRPAPDFSLGLSYRGAVDHRMTGSAALDLGPMATTQDAAADLRLPDMITLGLAWDVSERLTLLAGVSRFGWDRFKEVRLELEDGSELVSPENFRDTWSVSLGAEWKAHDRLTLRGGVQWDETPTVDAHRSTRIPDADRLWLAVGASYGLTENLWLDLSLSHMFANTEPINRAIAYADFATTIVTTGTTRARSNIIGVGLSSKF